MTAGHVTQEQLEILDRGDAKTEQFVEEMTEDMGQILWVRGLTRLQNQASAHRKKANNTYVVFFKQHCYFKQLQFIMYYFT